MRLRQLAGVVLLASIYFWTARLGFLIAQPPGNVTVFWPPSGLALAAILIGGGHLGLGVFAGSFLVNLGMLSGSAALPVAAAIATGSTLQAWAGAWLLRRFIWPLPPATPRVTLGTLAITGLTALLAPLCGVTSLSLGGFAPWGNFLALAWTGWLGDWIGILVFAPTLVVFALRWKKQPVTEPLLWPLTCFIVSLALLAFQEGSGWTSLLVGGSVAGAFLAYVDNRQKTEAALHQRDEEYRLISENTGDMIWILDQETQSFVYVSPAVEKLHGFSPREMLNQPLRTVFTAASLQRVEAVFPERLAAFQRERLAVTYTDEFEQIRKDGGVVMTEVATTFVKNAAGKIQLVGISRDITGRKQADELLLQQSEQLSILYEASQRLNRTLDLNEIYQEICDFMSVIAPNNGMIISSYDPETQLITCRAYWMENDWLDVRSFPAIPLEPEGQGTQSVAIRTGQSLLINDYQARMKSAQSVYYVDGETHEVNEGTSSDEEVVQSALIVPLKAGAQVTGVLQVTSYRRNAYTESQLKLLEALALHIVAAEKNALLYAQVQAELKERKQAEMLQKAVYQIAEAAQNAESLQELYAQLHRHIASVMYAENFYIAIYDEANDFLSFAYSVDEKDPVTPQPFRPGKGLTEYVLRTGKPLLCDALKKEELKKQAVYTPIGAASQIWLGVPLIVHGKTIGVMALQHYSDARAFSEREEHILEFVSSQIATAIDRKRASEMLQKSQASLEMAQSIAGLGSWELDLQIGQGSWSKEMFQLFQRDPGLGAPSLTGFLELIHPDDRQPLLEAQQRTLEARLPRTIEYRANPSEDNIRYFKSTLHPVLDAQGEVKHLSGTVLDITEIKNAQRELEVLNLDLEKRVEDRTAEMRQSEATYRALFENSNDGIFLFSATGEPLQANQHALEMIGYDLDEWRVLHRNQIVPVEQKANANQQLEAVLRGEQVPLYERTFVAKNGSRVETEINLSAIRDAGGKIFLVQSVVRDITARKKAADALRESEERYRRAISAADAVPYSLDYATNTYTFMGEGIERITGYTRDEMTPQLFDSFIQETKMRGELSDLSTHQSTQLVRTGQLPGTAIWRSDFRIRNKTGENRWLSDISVQVQGDNGRLTGSVGILQDVTERKEAEEALRESRDKLSAANAALEKASRLKDEFLASMSHELRTPLTGILGFSEALQMETFGQLNERQLKSIKGIEKSGRHLLELINDILDLSKIGAGKLDLQFEPCSAADICQSSLQLVKGLAHQKRQNISFSMTPGSINVRADARRLKQMLVNLLSNSIKFTPEGGQLGLEVQASEAEKIVRFAVWDKGIGIHPDELGKLFKPFVQLDSSLARQYAGTGLGLSLVQRMAELHGGSIQVESVPDQGSRFTILLPWSEGVTQPVPGLMKRDPATLKSALTVEDNELDAEHLTRTLLEIGIKNIVHPTVGGALEKAAFLQPSAIFLEPNLQDGSGLELLSRLKADERTREIPVIITSVEERRAEARALGVSGYLVKPVTQPDLRTELAMAIAFTTPAQRATVSLAPGLAPLVMMADDNEMILEIVTDFLETKGYRVIAARSGFELLERAPALHPALLLVDIQMPGMDGLETMRRLRAHSDPALACAPIIAVTALAMSGDRERCLLAGADDYMSKPIVLSQLIERIAHFLKEKTG
jgi:PAS domain S-box-containing protein